MNALWASTSVGSGRFSPNELELSGDEVAHRFEQLKERGQGYFEVRSPDQDYPLMTMGFRGGSAVVHLLRAPDSMSLHAGDASVPGDETVEVLIMDDPAGFTGDFVLGVDRAWNIVREFVRTGVLVGDWHEL